MRSSSFSFIDETYIGLPVLSVTLIALIPFAPRCLIEKSSTLTLFPSPFSAITINSSVITVASLATLLSPLNLIPVTPDAGLPIDLNSFSSTSTSLPSVDSRAIFSSPVVTKTSFNRSPGLNFKAIRPLDRMFMY